MSVNPQPAPEPSIVDASVQAADAWLRRFQAAVVGSMAVVAAGVGVVAFFTSFEAIKSYAKTSGGIAAEHAWAVPLLVDSFIVMATGADLWLSAARSRRWWEVIWPKLLLGGAAAVSFMLNVAHAGAGKWSARGVAAIPPAALVLSVELLVLIVRRAAMARTVRLAAAAAASSSTDAATTEVIRGDQTTLTVVAATGDRPALEATTATNQHTGRPGDHGRRASGDQPATASPAGATSGDLASGGATYRRVRELYVGGVTVAAEIARELGVSPSYAQRTLRRVKRDLAHQPAAPAAGGGRTTTHEPERSDQATSDPERQATRSPDQPTTPDPDRGATSRDQATKDPDRQEVTRDGDGRPTSDRHLMLVAPDRHHDHQEAER